MDGGITDFIILGATVLILSILILACVSLANTGTSVVNQFTNRVNERNSELDEADYLKYCTDSNTGSDVVSAVRKYKDTVEVKVTIYTDENTQSTLSTLNEAQLGDSFQNMPTDRARYINPSAKFSGSVVRSANDVIIGLTFTQLQYVALNTMNQEAATQHSADNSNSVSVDDAGSFTSNFSRKKSSVDDTESEEPSVVFSDEESNKVDSNGNNASSSGLKEISQTVTLYGSQLDDLNRSLNSISIDSEVNDVRKIKVQLSSLAVKIQQSKSELQQYALSRGQLKKYKNSFTVLIDRVNQAIASSDKLIKTIQSHGDTTTRWYVGYPVKTDVKVELKGNTLVVSGNGDASIGHDLPKWLKKSAEIQRVVFNPGLAITSIDYWFSGCTALKHIEGIPMTVKSANGTFDGCKSLTGTIDFGEKVHSVNGIFNGTKHQITVAATGTTRKTFQEYLKINKLKNIKIKEVNDK